MSFTLQPTAELMWRKWRGMEGRGVTLPQDSEDFFLYTNWSNTFLLPINFIIYFILIILYIPYDDTSRQCLLRPPPPRYQNHPEQLPLSAPYISLDVTSRHYILKSPPPPQVSETHWISTTYSSLHPLDVASRRYHLEIFPQVSEPPWATTIYRDLLFLTTMHQYII